MRWLACLVLLISQSAGSIEYLKVERLSIEYQSFKSGSRDPRVPTGFKDGVKLKLDWIIFGPLYWRNVIPTTTDGSQFRTIAWEFEVGSHLGPFDFGIQHFSGHLLDMRHPVSAFPVQDAIFFRVNLIQ